MRENDQSLKSSKFTISLVLDIISWETPTLSLLITTFKDYLEASRVKMATNRMMMWLFIYNMSSLSYILEKNERG